MAAQEAAEYPWLSVTELRYTLVCLVYLVHLVSFVQPNKQNKPKKLNELASE
jgi:hypothetical protein